MLSPSELRDRAQTCANSAAYHEYEAGEECDGHWNDVFSASVFGYFHELFEQVAELKEATTFLMKNESERLTTLRKEVVAEIKANPTPYLEPDQRMRSAPRILKASEITEPGWYAYRKPHGKWNVNMLSGLSYFTADKSTLANGWDDYELYGPIQLPE